MDLKVVLLTVEMLFSNLPEPNRGANYRGGLGLLARDLTAGMPDVGIDGMVFAPLYHRPWFNHNIELSYDSDAGSVQKHIIRINDQDYLVSDHRIYQGNQLIHGLECPEVFDVLYSENRQQRLLQEILIAKAALKILKNANFIPDVAWLNESHTAPFVALLKSDPAFAGTKILFTIHTPEYAGMERFYGCSFESLGVDDQFRPIFVRDDALDFTWAAIVLADVVNAVSEEHGEVTRNMFPQFRSKITGITNGVDIKFWMYPELAKLVQEGQPVTIQGLSQIHRRARREALDMVNSFNFLRLEDERKPRAWFVRRLAAYKNIHPMLVESGIIYAICADRGVKVNTSVGQLEGLGMQVVGAGIAIEPDETCLWRMREFERIARDELPGRFIFLPMYSLDLLKVGAWGSDVWLVTPERKREACGTSDQRAIINGIPVITTRTGGMMEYIQEFNPETGEGNGFFIDPYSARTLYEKLHLFSDLWFNWHENDDENPYSCLKINAFNVGRMLDIRQTLRKYKELFVGLTR